jgi:hypothetical protein
LTGLKRHTAVLRICHYVVVEVISCVLLSTITYTLFSEAGGQRTRRGDNKDGEGVMSCYVQSSLSLTTMIKQVVC